MYHPAFPLCRPRRVAFSAVSLAALGLLMLAAPGAAVTVETGRAGQITALSVGGNPVNFTTNVRIPLKGWTRMPSLDDARNVKITRDAGSTTWAGTIPVDTGVDYQYEQTVSEAAGGAVDLSLKVTANADVATEGVYFWIDVPREDFSGGRISLGPAGNPTASGVMPVKAPAKDPHFLSGTSDRLTTSDGSARNTVSLAFDHAIPIVAQDTRQWGGSSYDIFVRLSPSLNAGESASLKATLTATSVPDTTPVHLNVDATKTRYHLDGFGGDYCFNIESPVTQYTLKNLKVAWARTEASLQLWEPDRVNAASVGALEQSLEANDKPGSRLRHEFLLAKQIQGMGIPYVISVWQLPTWLYADPERGPDPGGRHVPDAKWPDLLQCLGSYLLYAKQQYGVEPNLFSFNEADYGVRVKLTPDEARDAIKRIGAYFRQIGLKTKMLLGDTGGPGSAGAYCFPTAADPAAMQYVGAVAFHSWGGATPAIYGGWGDLAERLHLPLLVTELGVDSGAWKTDPFGTVAYAISEAKMYQDLLLYARPQATVQWEFTADYSLVDVKTDATGQPTLTPTRRFFIVKQFCNLTPQNSNVLSTTSDAPKVLLTAFRRGRVYTFQIVNVGAARKAVIAGFPGRITRLHAVRTDGTENYKQLDDVVVKNGRAELDLAPQSLLTLTTMRVVP